MSARVNCVHAERCYRVRKVDPKRPTKQLDEFWRFCDCAMLGGGQEIGYECGKGTCDSYHPAKVIRRKSKAGNGGFE